MHQDLRVIQVGLGSFGRSWATVVQSVPGIELAAIVDPAPEAREWAASRSGLPAARLHASLNEAVGGIDADAVLVVTPPDTHHAVARQALLAGKHVLVEKPLATSLDEARDLIETARHAERLLVVSQNYRFRPPARAAQQIVAAGLLGDLLCVRATCRRDTRTLWPADNFRYAMRHPFVLDMAIHHFDLLRALTGRNVRRIECRSWRAPYSPYVHDPAVAALMELDGGIPFVYGGDWATHDSETSWNADWGLIGEAGRLLWTGGHDNANTGDVVLEIWGQAPAPVPQPTLDAVDRAGALQAFRDAILTGDPAETRAADNINSLAVVLGCVESIEENRAIEIG